MNKVSLVGRLTRDVEVRQSAGGTSVARFTVACDRRMKNADGNREADFISCVAFGKTAEFLEKYFAKGQRIGLTGRIQTGSYNKDDGSKVYTTDVIVEDVEFVESKGSGDGSGNAMAKASRNSDPEDFMNIDSDDESGLPFN